jgi:hypothetical protein
MVSRIVDCLNREKFQFTLEPFGLSQTQIILVSEKNLENFFFIIKREIETLVPLFLFGSDRGKIVEMSYVFGYSDLNQKLLFRFIFNLNDRTDFLVPSISQLFPEMKVFEEDLENDGWISFVKTQGVIETSPSFQFHEFRKQKGSTFGTLEELP